VPLELALLGGFVLLGLGNDGVHGDGGLAGGAVSDDQFALAASDGDHGVNGHDAGLNGNGDGFAGDDAGCDFFDRVLRITFDLTLAVKSLSKGVDDAAQQALADGDGEQAARGADFVASLDVLAGAEKHAADLGFLKVEGQAVKTAGEFDHFVEHDIAQAFDLGGAVTDLADDADVGFGDRRFEAGDLGFNLLEDVAHGCCLFGEGVGPLGRRMDREGFRTGWL